MTDDLDQRGWERRWRQVLRDQRDHVSARGPNPLLREVAADLDPGLALDAGCGHGAEARWLATEGWRVTAVDFSRAALDHGRAAARSQGEEVTSRLDWVQADLGRWTPPAGCFDLVSCLYVHVPGSVPELVRRLAGGVAPGGTLLLVGHRPVDPDTGEPTPAAGQVQVSVPEALEVLDAEAWSIDVAEDRRRPDAASGVDAVVLARRHA